MRTGSHQALRQEGGDVAAEVRQACMELDELFRARTVKASEPVSFFAKHGGSRDVAEKSFMDNWCLALEPEGDH